MNETQGFEISRRGVLKQAGVAAGIGALAALASLPLGAQAATLSSKHTDGRYPVEKSQLSTSNPDLMDLAGVRAEYQSAVATFPYPLPKGVVFPPASGLRSSSPGQLWERGSGKAEAFFFWHRATVAAAEVEHTKGNRVESHRLLDLLESAFDSNLRTEIWEDASGLFSATVTQARRGDFAALAHLTA